MKYRLLAYKDCKIGVFRNPFLYDKDNDELLVEVKTSFKNAKAENIDQLKDNALYQVGFFDNKTGEVIPLQEFIFDVYPIAASMIEEVPANVREERD